MRAWESGLILALCLSCGESEEHSDDPNGTDTSTDSGTDPNFDPMADEDGDGSLASEDCDDQDPTSYPGAVEHCDGADNDCEGDGEDGLVTINDITTVVGLQAAVDVSVFGDVLTICPGTYTENIDIPHSLTLQSLEGPTSTIIDADGQGSAMVVREGTLTLTGVTLTGGAGDEVGPGATAGGGLNAWDARVVVRDCVVRDNTASYGAGLIFGELASEVLDTEIYGNTAMEWGGGLYVGLGGELDVSGSSVHDNEAFAGGGLFGDEGSEISLLGMTEIWNNGAESGAGLYLWNMSLDGGVVRDNVASGYGGGIYLYGGGRLEDTQVLNNQAEYAGGVTLVGDVTLNGVLVEGNTATLVGGGLLVDVGVIQADAATSIQLNTSVAGGGLWMRDSTFRGGVITENAGEEGGGVFVSGTGTGVSELMSVDVLLNSATESGGGVFALGSLVMSSAVVEENTSDNRAGGVYISLGDLTMSGGRVQANSAVAYGGGIYVSADSMSEVEGTRIADNYAERGAGSYINGGGVLTLTECSIVENGNGATVTGGGARIGDGQLHSVMSDWGGGTSDNSPDDVFIDGMTTNYTAYTTDETFDCDMSGCDPVE